MRLSLRQTGLLAALVVFAADQISKGVMQQVVPNLWSRIVVTSFFNLNHAWNYGVSFSLFTENSPFRRGLLIGVALVLCVVVARWLWQAQGARTALACGMILGGALGNVCDRLRFGAVFDFLQFHLAGYYWPSFNLADSGIVIGVSLLLWENWRTTKKRS